MCGILRAYIIWWTSLAKVYILAQLHFRSHCISVFVKILQLDLIAFKETFFYDLYTDNLLILLLIFLGH